MEIRFAPTLRVGRQHSSNREIQQLPFPADIWALLVTIYENYNQIWVNIVLLLCILLLS